jgi:hypothetical protein
MESHSQTCLGMVPRWEMLPEKDQPAAIRHVVLVFYD